LAAPEAVTAATAEYLESEDAIAAWIDDRCERDVTAWSGTSALFASWASWASKAGENPGSQKKFSQRLRDRHFHKRDLKTGKGFDGLRILPIFEGEATWETR
jgi:putative DNA primase/helicase